MSGPWYARFECKIPPPIFMLAAMGLSYLLARYMPLIEFHFFGRLWFAMLLSLVGLFFAAESVLRFVRRGATINPHTLNKSQVLITNGFYSFTRNPMYVGLLAMLVGGNIALGALSSFISVPLFIVLVTRLQILPEERALSQQFPHAYSDYQRRVGRWL